VGLFPDEEKAGDIALDCLVAVMVWRGKKKRRSIDSGMEEMLMLG
jgi:hypothetical protein